FLSDTNVPSGSRIVYGITPTVNVSANPISSVFGNADPTLTYNVASGLIDGDTAATALSGLLTRAPGANVGSYAICQGGLTSPLGYLINFTPGSFQITPRPLTVTADNLSKVFGNLDPALTYSVTGGVIGSDPLSGAPTRAAGENAGRYVIDPHGVVGSSNY